MTETRHSSAALIDEFRRLQGEMYAGGEMEPVARMLADGVTWHVPGTSPIAGDHSGRAAVLAYFERRRALAGETMRMHVRERIAEEDLVVERVDGVAEIGGERREWRTVGVYRLAGGRIAEAWLVPADLREFDAIWLAVA